QSPVLSAELGELAWVLEARRIGERSLDLVGASERGGQPVTKWPESGASAGRSAGGLLRALLAEALHATSGIDQAPLAGEEGMAGRANVGVDLRAGRARKERVPARTLHGGGGVLGMDVGFHGIPLGSGRGRPGRIRLDVVAAH